MAKIENKQSAPEIQNTLNTKEAFVVKYKKTITACIVLLIALIGGGMIFKSCQNARQEKASSEMAVAQQMLLETQGAEMYMADSLLQVQYQTMLNGNPAEAVKGFLKIADEYSSTDAGNLANLYAGLCYMNMNKPQDAVKYLEKFDTEDDQMVSPAAMVALGNAYASLNQLDKAVEMIKKGAEKADNMTVSAQAYIQAAEILETQKKNAEALELYKKAKTYIDRMDVNAQQTLNRLNIDAYIERASQK